MFQTRISVFSAFFVATLLWSPANFLAQEVSAPLKTTDVVSQLRVTSFEKISSGLSGLRAISARGIEVVALKFKQSKFAFEMVSQKSDTGEHVDEMGQRANGLVAFNGGFFSIDKKGKKFPVGLLAKGQVHFSTPWKKSGGFLSFVNGELAILPTNGNSVPVADAVLQSKPVLIEPGSKWAMNTNRAIPKNRTLVCKDNTGDVILFGVVGGGLSLFEAGWVMRGKDIGGFFGCDSAIAMDGGGSTQIWVKDRPDLSYAGDTPVHNGVVIRQQQ